MPDDEKCRFDDGDTLTAIDGLHEYLRKIEAKLDQLISAVERLESIRRD